MLHYLYVLPVYIAPDKATEDRERRKVWLHRFVKVANIDMKWDVIALRIALVTNINQ